jgi:hypothetical protein
MAELDQFTVALKTARLAEAAHVEAIVHLNDARALRLQVLLDAVQAKLANNSRAQELLELHVVQGAQPRLWVDLVSSVVMEPDPRSYRLQQDSEISSQILFETQDMGEMAAYIIRHLARHVVVREKVAAISAAKPKTYSVNDMIYVWLMGIVFGSMALLILGLYLGKIQF